MDKYWKMSSEELDKYLARQYGVKLGGDIKQERVTLAYTLDSIFHSLVS